MLAEISHALRSLVRARGFTAVVVLTLGLGIGGITAIFTLVNSMVLRPLPYPTPERLVFLNEKNADFDGMSVSWPNFEDWRERNRSYEMMAAFRNANYNLTGIETPIRVEAQQATHELFDVFGGNFALGRPYTAEEDRPGAAPTAVLSYRLWSSQFGQDPAIVGRSITLHGKPYQVVGVTGPAVDLRNLSSRYDLWTPLGLEADSLANRGNHPGIYVAARLREGVTFEQAAADNGRIAKELQQEYPDSNAANVIRMRPLHEVLVGEMEAPLKLLLAAVGFVLLIVCANVANLLLARATRRRAESAVRAALGAGRGRLIRHLLMESFLLAAAGALLGWIVAGSVIGLLAANLPGGLPAGTEIRMDWTTLVFTAAIAAVAALVFGTAPAVHSSRVNLNDALRQGGRGAGAEGRHPLRAALVIGETALAAVLLVGSALTMMSFRNVVDANPGFDPGNLLTVRFSLPEDSYGTSEKSLQFAQSLIERVRELPGVTGAGIANPLLGGSQMGAIPEGFPQPKPGEYTPVDYAAVSPEHLQTMGVRLIEGRYFDEFDDASKLIVDETFAQKYWPNESALGKRVSVGGSPQDPNYREIVGVVSHVKNYGVDEESRIEMYLPWVWRPARSFTLAVRTSVDPQSLAEPVRGVVRELDAKLPVYGVQSMAELLGERVAMRRLAAWLMMIFGLGALLLAALGIYGVMSYNVSQRRTEVGLRMALGARRSSVLTMVVGQGARLIAVGLVIGLAAAFGLSRLLDSVLFGVGPTDASSYLLSAFVLTAVGVFASLLPALRASRLNPIEALRQD
jgi:predicted permease